MGKKKSYAKVVMECEGAVRNEPAVLDWPRPTKAPWSENGLLVGTRYFGDMCAVNPRKSATVCVVNPDAPEQIPAVPSSCVLL